MSHDEAPFCLAVQVNQREHIPDHLAEDDLLGQVVSQFSERCQGELVDD